MNVNIDTSEGNGVAIVNITIDSDKEIKDVELFKSDVLKLFVGGYFGEVSTHPKLMEFMDEVNELIAAH